MYFFEFGDSTFTIVADSEPTCSGQGKHPPITPKPACLSACLQHMASQACKLAHLILHAGSTAPQKLDVQSAIADTTDTFTLAALPSSWSGSHMLLHASLVTHPTTIDMVILHRLSSSPLLSHRSTHHGIWPAHTMLSSSHSYSTYNSNKVTRNDSGKAPKYDSSKPPKYDNSKRTSASQGPTHDNTQPMRPTHHQQRHQAQQRDRNQGSSRPTIAPNTLTVAASSSRAMRAAMGLGSGSREPQAAVVLAGVVEPEELTVSRFRNPVGLADLKDLIANHFKDMQPKHLCAAVRAIVDLKTVSLEMLQCGCSLWSMLACEGIALKSQMQPARNVITQKVVGCMQASTHLEAGEPTLILVGDFWCCSL